MKNNVVITGANRGIGLAFAQHYCARGDNVYAVCRQSSEQLGQLPNIHIIDQIDITQQQGVQRLISALANVDVDLLINNAGVLRNETLSDFNTQTITDQFMVNALAPLNISRALLPKLKQGSKIAFITSRMGSIADNSSGGRYGYRMSKAALNAGAVSLAKDLSERHIAVGVYHPGYVQTQMTQLRGDIQPEQAAKRLMALIETLDMNTSGMFFHANGEPLPW